MVERQCRICFDTENPETMITPCMCRGTSAYIHEDCFQKYLEYYPDRVCRVCHYRVPDPNGDAFPADTIVFLYMTTWLSILLLMSPVAEHYKMMYFFMLISVLVYSKITNVFRGVFGICVTCVSFLFTFLDPVHAVQAVVFFGLLAIIGVMFLYISPEIMLMFVAILLSGAYSIVIVSFFALKQDSYLTAFIVPIMIILWACVIRARPPLRG